MYDVVSYDRPHPFDFVLDKLIGQLPINTHYIYVPWRLTPEDIKASTFGCQGCGRIAYKDRGELGVCHHCDRELYCVYCTRILEFANEEMIVLSTLQQYDYVQQFCAKKPCNKCHYGGEYRLFLERE